MGLNLKIMNRLLSIFGLVGSFYGIYLGIKSEKLVLTIIYCCLDIISLVCCLLILFSTSNRNLSYAYWGYIISSYKMIIYFAVYLFYLSIVRWLLDIQYFDDPTYNVDLFGKFMETIMKIPITIYFLWINFSYTKHLALENYDIIDGKKYHF